MTAKTRNAAPVAAPATPEVAQYPPYDPAFGVREDYRVVGRPLGQEITLESLDHHEEVFVDAQKRRHPYRVFNIVGSDRGLSLSALTRYTTFGESEDWVWLDEQPQDCLVLDGNTAEENYNQIMEYLVEAGAQLTVVGRGHDRFGNLYYAFA